MTRSASAAFVLESPLFKALTDVIRVPMQAATDADARAEVMLTVADLAAFICILATEGKREAIEEHIDLAERALEAMFTHAKFNARMNIREAG